MSNGLSRDEAVKATGLLGRINEGEFFTASVKVIKVLKPKSQPVLKCRLLTDFELRPGHVRPRGTEIMVGPEMFTPNTQWKPLAADLSSEVTLPDYDQCDRARTAGNATPLELFIYDHCPGGNSQEKKFFKDLKRTIEFCIEKRLRGDNAER